MNWSKIQRHLRPEKHWALETKRRIESIIDEYAITDTGGLLLLQQFGNAESREIQAREQISIDGQTIQDRFGQDKPHPLLAVERDARSQKLQALKALNLDVEPLRDGPGRPGGR